MARGLTHLVQTVTMDQSPSLLLRLAGRRNGLLTPQLPF